MPLIGALRDRKRARSIQLLILALLVIGSASVRFVAALGLKAPWIAPDEMAYGLLGRSFWETGRMQILNGSTRSYGLYPILPGLPLALFGAAKGLFVLKAFQAMLVTSTILVVYVWARRPAGGWWALAAAALTAALPGFAYSGLIMSEAAFVPAAALTLWLLARALVTPSLRNQVLLGAGVLLAVAMRYQGVVLLPTIVGSICLMAWFSRDRRVIRRFAPTLWTLAGVAALWAVISLFGSGANVLGAYSIVGNTSYSVASALRWIIRHAGDVFLLVLGAPLIATAILVAGAVRSRERDPGVQALLAVALAYTLLVVVEVGIFASRFVHHLAERDLMTLAPPLFVAFAVWLSRGLPRPQPSTTIAAIVVALPALLLPMGSLVTAFAVPDTFTIVPLLNLLERTSTQALEHAWIAGVVGVAALTILVPRRFGVLLVALVGIGLVASSVLAQHRIDALASLDRHEFFGTASPHWIDDAANGPVVYVDDGDFFWNASWQLAFWNAHIKEVATLGRTPGQLPGGGVHIRARPDGLLVDSSGSALKTRLVLARQSLSLVGTRVRYVSQAGDEPGLTLWRTPSAPTVSAWTQGFQSSYLGGPVTLTVFRCTTGRLELTLVPEDGLPTLTLQANGLRARTLELPPNDELHGYIEAPPSSGKSRKCVFRIVPHGLVQATRLAFRRGPAIRGAANSGSGITDLEITKTVPLTRKKERISYCFGSSFETRTAGYYKGGTPANYIEGIGLACTGPPPGFKRHGFARSDLNVPDHTYPYYAP